MSEVVEIEECGAVLSCVLRVGAAVVEGARVEVLRVAFRSREEDRRAVSLAWRSVAMRWAKGTSSMRRKSRVEAATWGFEGAVSVVCDVVVAMMLFLRVPLLLLLLFSRWSH